MTELDARFLKNYHERSWLVALHWSIGFSLHTWAFVSQEMRNLMVRIRANKGLEEIPLFTQEAWGKRRLDGRPLVAHFKESCKASPSYAAIPLYQSFERELDRALDARDFLVHDLVVVSYEHSSEYPVPGSTKPFEEHFGNARQLILNRCHKPIAQSASSLITIKNQIEERLK